MEIDSTNKISLDKPRCIAYINIVSKETLMRYQFPKIQTIQDVLPHIQGRDEFVVAERDSYTVINYVVSMSDTFEMTGPDDLTGAMRRECRGLIFDKAGMLISRPFHKFFNVNEREETQMNVIDLSQPHVIMEKMDGSMIRPLIVDGYLRLGTKMGVTEVAMQAEIWLAAQDPEKMDWLRTMVESGSTPLFEWISRKNQIVIDYANEDLVYLGSRRNITGEYYFNESAPFTHVPRYGNVEGNLTDYVARQRSAEGREGDIIRFADGHMLKIKNDWYVRIHKTIDKIRFDRHIVELILHEEIDDAIPMLPPHEADRVRKFELRFADRLHTLIAGYDRYYHTVLASGLDRKRYAQEWMPSIQQSDSFAPNYVFGRFGNRDGRKMIIDHIEKHLTTNVRWDECARWMGM
jgi:RNA ligase